MSEVNPNHPVTQSMRDQWHKIVVLLMQKMGVTETVIPMQELVTFESSSHRFITIQFDDSKGIMLKLLTEKEAMELAAKAGGMPH